jgi:hypothetical protein
MAQPCDRLSASPAPAPHPARLHRRLARGLLRVRDKRIALAIIVALGLSLVLEFARLSREDRLFAALLVPYLG